jgi:hypothetical protein
MYTYSSMYLIYSCLTVAYLAFKCIIVTCILISVGSIIRTRIHTVDVCMYWMQFGSRYKQQVFVYHSETTAQ